MKEYDASCDLWDEVYSECELADIQGNVLHVEPTFDACLDVFAQNCKRVLDYGCGTGDVLFQCADYGYLTYGLGIDRSTVGIQYAAKMAKLNDYRNLKFLCGDLDVAGELPDGSFDGIILSNVLDVVPKEMEAKIVKEATRLLTDHGLMFVKMNPYATQRELEANGLVRMQENLYLEDGILRLRNRSTETWKQEFESDFIVERYLEFPYPWQEGMNRLFLLRKRPAVHQMHAA